MDELPHYRPHVPLLPPAAASEVLRFLLPLHHACRSQRLKADDSVSSVSDAVRVLHVLQYLKIFIVPHLSQYIGSRSDGDMANRVLE